jgi:hypothetical protein
MGRKGLWAHRVHAVLLAIVCAECVLAAALHRTEEELQRDLRTGTPRQKVYALFVLTNRDVPESLDAERVGELVNSPEVLVREWTMTANFVRMGSTRPQAARLVLLGGSPEGVRCRFLLDNRDFQAGVTRRMALSDLRRFLGATMDSR